MLERRLPEQAPEPPSKVRDHSTTPGRIMRYYGVPLKTGTRPGAARARPPRTCRHPRQQTSHPDRRPKYRILLGEVVRPVGPRIQVGSPARLVRQIRVDAGVERYWSRGSTPPPMPSAGLDGAALRQHLRRWAWVPAKSYKLLYSEPYCG
jgi:hypothetical protein